MLIKKIEEIKNKITLESSYNFWILHFIYLLPVIWAINIFVCQETQRSHINSMREQTYLIERGAEDDAEDLALSQNQIVNYVRCFQRSSGTVSCIVHTPPADIRVTCLARANNQILVDGKRCRWDDPSSMAHP